MCNINSTNMLVCMGRSRSDDIRSSVMILMKSIRVARFDECFFFVKDMVKIVYSSDSFKCFASIECLSVVLFRHCF